MNVAARLGAFALILAVTFGGGWALGAATGPDAPAQPAAPVQDQPHMGGHP